MKATITSLDDKTLTLQYGGAMNVNSGGIPVALDIDGIYTFTRE